MDARPLSRRVRRPRSGFTWVELIVCFAIIGLLVALLLPAIRNTKPIARRTECRSNLRNVCIAFHAYSTSKRGALPPLTGGLMIANPHPDKRAGFEIEAPWSVTILPYMEQTKLYDRLRITDDNPVQWQRGTTGGIGADEAQLLAQTAISTYLCPDPQNRHAGGLSYVANAGIIPEDSWSTADFDTDHSADRLDFGSNGYGAENHNPNDAELAYATGVFWHVPVGTPTDKNTPAPSTSTRSRLLMAPRKRSCSPRTCTPAATIRRLEPAVGFRMRPGISPLASLSPEHETEPHSAWH